MRFITNKVQTTEGENSDDKNRCAKQSEGERSQNLMEIAPTASEQEIEGNSSTSNNGYHTSSVVSLKKTENASVPQSSSTTDPSLLPSQTQPATEYAQNNVSTLKEASQSKIPAQQINKMISNPAQQINKMISNPRPMEEEMTIEQVLQEQGIIKQDKTKLQSMPIQNQFKSPIRKITYKDHLHLPDPIKEWRNTGGVAEAFPEKLHRMLFETETNTYHHSIVSFFPHGRAFGMHKPKLFVTEVLPKYFRQTSLISFQRQLNLYGFQRISHGPDCGGYFHELFLRGRRGLVVNMRRTRVKGKVKSMHDRETEPDFYKMRSCPTYTHKREFDKGKTKGEIKGEISIIKMGLENELAEEKIIKKLNHTKEKFTEIKQYFAEHPSAVGEDDNESVIISELGIKLEVGHDRA